MLVLEREELKEKYPHVIKAIQAKHVMEENVFEELYVNNKPVKGLAHSRYYFLLTDEFYIRYCMDHIIMDVKKKIIGRSVLEVIFYESYQEFEAARVSQLSTGKGATGLNHN